MAPEATTRVGVTVTFMRMDTPPYTPAPLLPAQSVILRVERPTVPFYRFLYHTVGNDYVWWLRRAAADAELAALLADPRISIHVLYHGGQPAGFFEVDRRPAPDVNLSYFGLMPHAVGKGFGPAFLRAAVDTCWRDCGRGITVNTCNADHPRALPGYLAGGFRMTRSIGEIWDVPNRLGLKIPEHLILR
jgi:GNAT superfamily N-acetyltransferase